MSADHPTRAELRDARDLIVQLQRELERAREVIADQQRTIVRAVVRAHSIEEERMNADMSRSTNLRVNLKWLGLTLSARSLARELLRHADADGFIPLRAEALADPVALGGELARLLCAHRREQARVRDDVKALIDGGTIVVDDEGIHLAIIDEDAVEIEQPRVVSSSAVRMRRHRERNQASHGYALDPSHVTSTTVTRDAPSDGGDASRALSLRNNLDLKPKRESAREDRAKRPIPPDLVLTESCRARALRAGIDENEIDQVWTAFVAHYIASAKTSADWDATWTTWVVREVGFRTRSTPPNGPSMQSADMNAPWIVAAMEAS